MKRLTRYLFITVCTVFVCLFFSKMDVFATNTSAAYKECGRLNRSITVKGISFRITTQKEELCTDSTIQMKQNGRWKTIAKDVYSVFYTNGTYVLYNKSEPDSGQRTESWSDDFGDDVSIYLYNVQTGKTTFLVKGVGYTVLGAASHYVYIGSIIDGVGSYVHLYDRNTKKMSFLQNNADAVSVGSRRILISFYSDEENYNVFTYNFDGTGKKRIAKAARASLKGRTVTYYVTKFPYIRKYQCTDLGKNKKAITGWVFGY